MGVGVGGWGGCGVCVDILHGLEEDSPAGGEEEEDEEMVDNNWWGNWGQLCRHPGCDEEKYGTEMREILLPKQRSEQESFCWEKRAYSTYFPTHLSWSPSAVNCTRPPKY